MTAPTFSGLHHLKLPVSDLDASLGWYERVLGATRLDQFDHFDNQGVRYAVILALPGLDTTVELRWAPMAAAAMRGYDPINFAVSSLDEVQAWQAHLDALGVAHSPLTKAAAGNLLVFADPDGTYLRVCQLPEGGVEQIVMPKDNPEPEGPWFNPTAMQHRSTA